MATRWRGTSTISAARSTTARAGVERWPMVLRQVMTADSQWKKSRNSPPEMPGNRYLWPPEKPTISCGNTGPTIRIRS